MKIYLELNQRHGHGFQVHIQHGPMDWTYDQDTLNMYEAGACAQESLDRINEELGTDFKPHQVLCVTEEAMKANAKTDFAAARMLQDIQSGRYDLSTPAGGDVCSREVDGETETMLSARGVALFAYLTWMDEQTPKARAALVRYCQYIALHGFKGGAEKALAELDAQEDKDAGLAWIRRTYARHVKDPAALVGFLMGQ